MTASRIIYNITIFIRKFHCGFVIILNLYLIQFVISQIFIQTDKSQNKHFYFGFYLDTLINLLYNSFNNKGELVAERKHGQFMSRFDPLTAYG